MARLQNIPAHTHRRRPYRRRREHRDQDELEVLAASALRCAMLGLCLAGAAISAGLWGFSYVQAVSFDAGYADVDFNWGQCRLTIRTASTLRCGCHVALPVQSPTTWWPGMSWGKGRLRAQMPAWQTAVLLAIWPTIALIRRRRRGARGGCPICGYDIRATPERCPECGHYSITGITP